MRRTQRFLTAVVLSTTVLGTAACTSAPKSSAGQTRTLIEACKGPVNGYVAFDGTSSGDNGPLDGPRLRALKAALTQVAVCGGHAKVVVFSSSSAATTTLFEGRVELKGATNQAKARRLEPAVAEVSEQVSTAYAKAVPSLEGGGSDPVAQLRLFGEWMDQVENGEFQFLAITDGFQTAGVSLKQITVDPERAAASFKATDLSGSTVTFAGIGELADSAPQTTVVDALKDFYEALCQNSGADRCRVISEVSGVTS